jgi:hypothetical protein
MINRLQKLHLIYFSVYLLLIYSPFPRMKYNSSKTHNKTIGRNVKVKVTFIITNDE